MQSISARIRAIEKKIADHRLEVKKLGLDIERVQLDCPHGKSSTRSIMGRDTVVECVECGKEL